MVEGRYKNPRPSLFVRYIFRLVEDFLGEKRGTIAEGFHHGHEGIVDVGLEVNVLRQEGVCAIGPLRVVRLAKHVEGPEAQGQVSLLRRVEEAPQVLDGVLVGTGDRRIVPGRSVGPVDVHSESQGVALLIAGLPENVLERSRVCEV